MADTASRRLPKAQRREQLLETALEIVREQGTDALTLGHLAERAGISKPIAYEHFGTRAGLLIALFKKIDDVHVTAFRDALGRAPRRLEDVAAAASAAYMRCYRSVGPEWHALSSALNGDEQMEAFRHELLDSYAALYRDAFAPYSDLPAAELHLRSVAIIGAAEAISRDMLRGRFGEKRAATALASLTVAWLSRA